MGITQAPSALRTFKYTYYTEYNGDNGMRGKRTQPLVSEDSFTPFCPNCLEPASAILKLPGEPRTIAYCRKCGLRWELSQGRGVS